MNLSIIEWIISMISHPWQLRSIFLQRKNPKKSIKASCINPTLTLVFNPCKFVPSDPSKNPCNPCHPWLKKTFAQRIKKQNAPVPTFSGEWRREPQSFYFVK